MAQAVPTIDYFSACALQLELFFDEILLSTATGFFYRKDNLLALVTNWHVLSGRNPKSGQPLDPKGSIPNALRFFMHLTKPGAMFYGPRFSLLSDDGKVIWKQHPQKGQDIDVAALIFTSEFFDQIRGMGTDVLPHAINDNNSEKMLNHAVGAEVFVLGYPLGLAVQKVLPIWKRASVASEPEVPIDGLPMFLIDTATRQGMSGAPVLARHYGWIYFHGGEPALSAGPATSFIGVYSGRLGGDQELSAQLGRVWRKEVIDSIVADGIPGTYILRM